MGLVYVRGVLCVGTVLLFGTDKANFTISCCCSPHSLGLGSSSLVRETNFQYVTRGLGLVAVLFGCFFALLVPFFGIGDDGDVIVAFGREFPFFVANFVVCWNALLRCSIEWTRWCV